MTGIVYFDQINKSAYRLALVKDSGSNSYRSRIGFNFGPLPIGYYTFVCEFFPVVMSNASVTAQATTISINSQTTKTFPTYTKTLVQFHRWNSTPPQFIYLDLHGSAPGGSRVLAHMVVYGVKGYVPNVDPSVFDTAFVIDNGKMVLETDLNLNGHQVSGMLSQTNSVMTMQTDLNLNGNSLIGKNGGGFGVDDDGRVQLRNELDLNGHGIRDVLSVRRDELVMQNKLDLNGQMVLDRFTPLFRYQNHALRFLKAVVVPGMVIEVESSVVTSSSNMVEFQLPAFWAPYNMFSRVVEVLLTSCNKERSFSIQGRLEIQFLNPDGRLTFTTAAFI